MKTKLTNVQPTTTVFAPFNETGFNMLKQKIFGSESEFFHPVPKESMLNKTENELKDILKDMGMVAEESGKVKLYKTSDGYMNRFKKPEQPSLVFINGVFAFSSYPYSIELTPEKLEKFDFDIITKCRFFEATEGTVLRVFNANGEWYTITNKRLDAFCSKWAAKTKTFGCHLAKSIFVLLNPDHTGDTPDFDDVVIAKEYVNQIWSDSLDISKRYLFLLKPSTEERIVCDAEEAILNIGVIDENNKLSLDFEVKLTDSSKTIAIPKPVEHSFSSLNDLNKKINNIDLTKYTGLLAIFKTDFSEAYIEDDIEKHIHVKILNPKYYYLNSLRGNYPSLRFRLFQLIYLTNIEMQMNQTVKPCYVEDFIKLYPQCKGMTKVVWTVVQDLFQKYQSIYVKHEETNEEILPKTEKMLSVIHNEYMISKQPTTTRRIADILSYIEPEKLNQLIREHESRIKREIYNQQQALTQ